MAGKLIVAPNYDTIDGKLIFLAGPIQGAPKWQDDAIKLIRFIAPEMNIASPRREINAEKDFTKKMYDEQVDWETYYLRRAGEEGVILFWLPKPAVSIPGRAYAQTSRFELGEWKEKHIRKGAHIVVGIESGFSNESYIRRRFMQDCPDVPVSSSLEGTVKKAVSIYFNLS